MASLYRVIPKPPASWLKTAPSTAQLVQMVRVWDAAQVALSEVPPGMRNGAWARRHSDAWARYLLLVADGVEEEPTLHTFACEVKKLQEHDNSIESWPFSDFRPVRDGYTICNDAGVSDKELAEMYKDHKSLRVVPEVEEILVRLYMLRVKLAKLRVLEMGISCAERSYTRAASHIIQLSRSDVVLSGNRFYQFFEGGFVVPLISDHQATSQTLYGKLLSCAFKMRMYKLLMGLPYTLFSTCQINTCVRTPKKTMDFDSRLKIEPFNRWHGERLSDEVATSMWWVIERTRNAAARPFSLAEEAKAMDTYVAAVRTLGLRYTPLELLLKQVLDTMWDEDLVERAMLGIEEGMAGVLVADQQNVDVHDGYLQGADAQDQDLRDANPQDQDLQDVNVQDQDVEADDVVTVPRRAAGKRKKTVTLKLNPPAALNIPIDEPDQPPKRSNSRKSGRKQKGKRRQLEEDILISPTIVAPVSDTSEEPIASTSSSTRTSSKLSLPETSRKRRTSPSTTPPVISSLPPPADPEVFTSKRTNSRMTSEYMRIQDLASTELGLLRYALVKGHQG